MINKQTLSKIFKSPNIVFIGTDSQYGYFYLEKNKKLIFIYTNKYYTHQKYTLKEYCKERKNCWVKRENDRTIMYFSENYILSNIRQKTINTLLND